MDTLPQSKNKSVKFVCSALDFRYLRLSPKIGYAEAPPPQQTRTSSVCVRLNRGFGCGSVKAVQAEYRKKQSLFSHAEAQPAFDANQCNQTSLLPLLSPIAIIDCADNRLHRNPYTSAESVDFFSQIFLTLSCATHLLTKNK